MDLKSMYGKIHGTTLARKKCQSLIELTRAGRLSRSRFDGVIRRGIEPYSNHNQRMTDMAIDLGLDVEVATVCYLHDILEKTPCSLSELKAQGFSKAIIDAVIYLTMDDDLPFTCKMDRAERGGVLAIIVAMLDQLDNLLILEGEDWPGREAAYVRYNKRIQDMQKRWELDFRILFDELGN